MMTRIDVGLDVAVFLGTVLAFGCTAAAEGLTLPLAERNRPCDCRLVLPKEPTPVETYAAEELARYVQEMTGVSFSQDGKRSVVFERGDAALGDDGFRLRVKDGDLHLAGGARGILYAVYELLETYGGVGWFGPDRTVVPSRETFAVPADLDVTQRPAFEMRDSYWRLLLKDGDYCARLRLNGVGPALEARHGGRVEWFGGELGNCHTFATLCPGSKYGKDHPEYFALRGGRRMNAGNPQESQQLCLTNPDVLKVVTEGVLETIRRHPEARYFGVSQNDNMNYCECKRCAAVDEEEESHAGTMVRFVNAVAEAVEREFPDKIIETLAYQYTRKPPKKTRLRSNVMPCLCTIECDFAHPLATGRARHNVSFRDDIAGWSRMSSRLYVWDYVTDFNHLPGVFPNFDVLQPNIRFFRDRGVSSLYENGGYVGAEFDALKSWLIAKWLWNPDLPEKPLLDRFFPGYYGKAAPLVREYFDRLRALPRPDGAFQLGCFVEMNVPMLVDDSFLMEARKLLDRAEDVAKTEDPTVLRHVRHVSFSVDYTLFQRAKGVYLSDRWFSLKAHPAQPAVGAAEFVAAGRRVLDYLKTDDRIRVAGYDARNQQQIKELRDATEKPLREPRFEPCSKVVLEESALSLGAVGRGCVITNDATASGGMSLYLNDRMSAWCANVMMSDGEFDAGVRLRARAKVRFAKKQGAPDGVILTAGVYDTGDGRYLNNWSWKSSQVKDVGWQWIDLGSWMPEQTHQLWVGMGTFDKKVHATNPCTSAVWIDQIELSRD